MPKNALLFATFISVLIVVGLLGVSSWRSNHELEKLRGQKVLCFFGEKEKQSICRTLDPTLVTAVHEPGSHHFAGNYKGIAETILAATR